MSSASASAAEEPSPPPATAGCSHAIAPGTDLAHVPDATLRALVLRGAPGATTAHDCLGAVVEYTRPMTPHVDRFVADATHMAIFVSLAQELGYTSHCPGVAAIVRVDATEIVTEGVGPEEIDDCDAKPKLHLVMLDGHHVLLFPHVTSNGENGDFSEVWTAWTRDDHDALGVVGRIRSTLSMGNESITSGKWFASLESTVLDAGAFQIEERWELLRMSDGGGEEHGKKRTIIRTYGVDGSKLTTSPNGDPFK